MGRETIVSLKHISELGKKVTSYSFSGKLFGIFEGTTEQGGEFVYVYHQQFDMWEYVQEVGFNPHATLDNWA